VKRDVSAHSGALPVKDGVLVVYTSKYLLSHLLVESIFTHVPSAITSAKTLDLTGDPPRLLI
jgi:hypothetical protein